MATSTRDLAVEPEPPATIAVQAPPAAQDIRDTTLVKERDLFMLADLEGNVPLGSSNGFGLYHGDSRFLSAYELRIQGLHPTVLLSSGRWPYLGSYVLTNPNLVTEDGRRIAEQSLQIRRYRIARALRLSESLVFQSYNSFPLTLTVALHVGADFADIFDVRGFVTESVGPRAVQVEYGTSEATFRYHGRDGIERSTRVRFDPPPTRLGDGLAEYRIELSGRAAQRIAVEIDVGAGTPAPPRKNGRPLLGREAIVRTSNTQFDTILGQAQADLQMLASGDDDGLFVAAGIPWYAALFGRDSIITALEHLWLAPALAKHTLVLLARYQGRHDDPSRDEEPGKILHETRRGELANVGLVPFAPYYGSVDATPLWIMLLGEYYRATNDLALVRELRGNLERALRWIDEHGDVDGDGFVEYRARAAAGLVNQGWKDSWDGIVNADGSLAEPPIALVEVQAYVHEAKLHAARLFRALGDDGRARSLETEAGALRERFAEAFWMPTENCYCLALDGRKRQVAVVSSNAGHALYGGIASREHGELVADRLLTEDIFSGWGVRTLSTREVRYNPVGYHVGTVWPHDNALIAFGLKRYGAEEQLVRLSTGLFDASKHFPSGRMPELFAGFARSAFDVPVRYPVACSPQAWAAASWSMILQSLLGVSPDGCACELSIVRPRLPPWLEWARVENIQVGSGEVDLLYQRVSDRTVVDVLAMRGGVRVIFSDRWPR